MDPKHHKVTKEEWELKVKEYVDTLEESEVTKQIVAKILLEEEYEPMIWLRVRPTVDRAQEKATA